MHVNGKDLWNNTWYSDPVFLGHYPEQGLEAYGVAVPKTKPGDFEIISAPLDFLGLNIYTAAHARAAGESGWQQLDPERGVPRTTMDWP